MVCCAFLVAIFGTVLAMRRWLARVNVMRWLAALSVAGMSMAVGASTAAEGSSSVPAPEKQRTFSCALPIAWSDFHVTP